MKFQITMKDSDCLGESLTLAVAQMIIENPELDGDNVEAKLSSLVDKWFDGEYLTVEIDTETENIKVCEAR